MHLFHYHLVTSQLRDVEARYLGKLGFDLIARYGRIGDEHVAVEAGVSWEKLDHDGFKLRLSELERGAVNVVVQPGQWELPRVDHLGLALDVASRAAVDERAEWLVGHGAEIESGPEEYGYIPGYYAVFFYDPDGIKLEIVHVPGRAA